MTRGHSGTLSSQLTPVKPGWPGLARVFSTVMAVSLWAHSQYMGTNDSTRKAEVKSRAMRSLILFGWVGGGGPLNAYNEI